LVFSKKVPRHVYENSVKNRWADEGGGIWWRVEAQTTTNSETVKKQGVVNNKKGS
jgi:hypothetical protein